MKEFVSFFNQNTGFITAILTASLVSITGYYAVLTREMSYNSSQSIEQTREIIEENKKEHRNTKNNYLFLLNSELFINSGIYAMGIYYLTGQERSTFLEKFKYLLQNGAPTVPKVVKAFIREYAKSDAWDQIKNECAKYLPNELMEELVGYYAGVKHSKIYSIDGMSNEGFMEFAKGQLISTMKCFELLDREGIQLRRKETYEIEKYVFKIDKSTGELIKQ